MATMATIHSTRKIIGTRAGAQKSTSAQYEVSANNNNNNDNNNDNNEIGSRSPCMRPRSDPPNFGPIERGEKQTNNID